MGETAYDFLEPRRLGPRQIDFAFTDLVRDQDSRAWTRLWALTGRSARSLRLLSPDFQADVCG